MVLLEEKIVDPKQRRQRSPLRIAESKPETLQVGMGADSEGEGMESGHERDDNKEPRANDDP